MTIKWLQYILVTGFMFAACKTTHSGLSEGGPGTASLDGCKKAKEALEEAFKKGRYDLVERIIRAREHYPALRHVDGFTLAAASTGAPVGRVVEEAGIGNETSYRPEDSAGWNEKFLLGESTGIYCNPAGCSRTPQSGSKELHANLIITDIARAAQQRWQQNPESIGPSAKEISKLIAYGQDLGLANILSKAQSQVAKQLQLKPTDLSTVLLNELWLEARRQAQGFGPSLSPQEIQGKIRILFNLTNQSAEGREWVLQNLKSMHSLVQTTSNSRALPKLLAQYTEPDKIGSYIPKGNSSTTLKRVPFTMEAYVQSFLIAVATADPNLLEKSRRGIIEDLKKQGIESDKVESILRSVKIEGQGPEARMGIVTREGPFRPMTVDEIAKHLQESLRKTNYVRSEVPLLLRRPKI